ncbi:MAG: GspE/PulE family protein [Vampirovibrionales bacterium]
MSAGIVDGNASLILQSVIKYVQEVKGMEPEVLVAIMERAEQDKITLDEQFLKEGFLTREDLVQIITKCFSVKYYSLENVQPNMELLELIPEEIIEEKHIVPVANTHGRLVIAMLNPTDRSAVDEITFLTGMRPQIVSTLPMDHRHWMAKFVSQQELRARGNKENTRDLMDQLANASEVKLSAQAQRLDNIRAMGQAEIQDTTDPLVRFVNSLLIQGVVQGASDIHIEPREGHYVVRFRSDGVLKEVLEIPTNMEGAVITRLKVMAKMDISDHRRPQDGRMSINYKKMEYNFRVNTLPVTEGREKMVMRILRPSATVTDFTKLGFTQEDANKIELMYKAPYGIVLVCGPTGSGKSTTLYTIMNKINSELINVSTVEDPVELKIEGLNQSQVNAKADFTFASSMRALLRQDPDVIMVGEIRDYETLEAGIHAALTGHLVFSTIHANSTATTITRMLEMGASSSLISAAVNGVIAQRLTRALCPHCKEAHEATDEQKEILYEYYPTPPDLKEPLTIYKAKGCEMCKDSGYFGRTGLYEIMMIDRELRHLIAAQVNELEIEDTAMKRGMISLGMCARTKIIEGKVDFAEIERVLGPFRGGSR